MAAEPNADGPYLNVPPTPAAAQLLDGFANGGERLLAICGDRINLWCQYHSYLVPSALLDLIFFDDATFAMLTSEFIGCTDIPGPSQGPVSRPARCL